MKTWDCNKLCYYPLFIVEREQHKRINKNKFHKEDTSSVNQCDCINHSFIERHLLFAMNNVMRCKRNEMRLILS